MRGPTEEHTVALEIEALRDRVATMAAGAILLIGIPVLISFALTDLQPILLGLAFGMFASLGAAIQLIRAGRGVVGRYLLLGVVATTLLGRATFFGGVDSVPFVGWVVVVLLSAVLIGPRAGWIAAAFGILAGGVLFGLESSGLLPDALRPNTPLTALRIGSALFLIVGLLAWALTTRIEEGLHRFADVEADRGRLIERYELAGRGAQFGIWDYDPASDTVWLGPGIQALLAEPVGVMSISGDTFRERIHPDDREAATGRPRHHLTEHLTDFSTDYRIRKADGQWLWVQSRGCAIPGPGGAGTRMVGSLIDVSSGKRMEGELRHRAFHDPLTGLPNRELFLDRVGQALADSRRADVADFAVVFLDIDRFKLVNDSLGHASGDALLLMLAQRLSATVREPDTVACMGGDEFTLLLRGVADMDASRIVADRVGYALELPFVVAGREVAMRASIGILMGSLEYTDPEDLLRDAHLAMYAAKAEPSVTVGVFEPELRTRARSLLELDTTIRGGLERREFVPWYQPIVDLRTGAMVGVEALARWPQPDGSVRSPAWFIARAEETGLVAELDRQIVERAVLDLAPYDGLILSVNLSARQFRDRSITEWLLTTLERAGMPPERLQVEVTETVLLSDRPGTRQTFTRLTELGMRVALDDFGTGYSSLSYLHRLDLQVLKIDISFVQELGPFGPGPICEAILSVADKLGLGTSAEGIETEAQREALIALGCTHGQGYLFSKPLPLAALFDAPSMAVGG